MAAPARPVSPNTGTATSAAAPIASPIELRTLNLMRVPLLGMPSAPGVCAGNAEIGLRRNPHQDRTARTSNVTPVVAWNYAAVWDGIAQEVPDREAVVCGERRLTWRAFSERAHRLAAHLQHCGLVAGDKVAIDLPNRTEYLEAFYGALVLGCVPVNVNFRYTADEIHYVLDNSDAMAVIHAPGAGHERRRRR